MMNQVYMNFPTPILVYMKLIRDFLYHNFSVSVHFHRFFYFCYVLLFIRFGQLRSPQQLSQHESIWTMSFPFFFQVVERKYVRRFQVVTTNGTTKTFVIYVQVIIEIGINFFRTSRVDQVGEVSGHWTNTAELEIYETKVFGIPIGLQTNRE